MVQLQETIGDYESLGYQVLAISQDTPQENAKFMIKSKLSFPILSDQALEASKKFGLVFSIDEKTVGIYKNYNIDLVGLYGLEQPLMPVPAIFIVKDGTIQFSYVNPNYAVRLEPAILRAAMTALK